MRKLLLLSILISMIAVPLIGATARTGRQSVGKTALMIVVFNLLALLALQFVYQHVH
jgi:hypothetical protein